MRFVYRAMCAVALAGCADVKTPVETKSPTLSPADPSGRTPPNPRQPIDSRTIGDRIEGLYNGHLSKVSIPADGFSKFGDAVHPDIACPPGNWNNAPCWVMYTPYKNSDPSNENPAFLMVSSDTEWTTPPAVANPLIAYPGITGYNSDPDHAFDPATRRMVQVYRVVADSFNKIMVMSTADARHWTTPVVAFTEHNHNAVSPALVIEPDRQAKLWYVRAGADGCNATSTSVEMRTALPEGNSGFEAAKWSAGTPVNLSIPGYVVWHLDVIELPAGRGYLAMIAAYQKFSNCANSDVWLATSRDGVNWQSYAVPIFWRTMRAAKTLGLSTWYRGTMRYDAATDSLDLWPSGMSKLSWGVFHATARLSDLLDLLNAAQPSDYRPPAFNRLETAIPIQMP
ncbi:MAG: hypothetical protein ABI085_14865 [Gemmatimonadaceae bacterium]